MARALRGIYAWFGGLLLTASVAAADPSGALPHAEEPDSAPAPARAAGKPGSAKNGDKSADKDGDKSADKNGARPIDKTGRSCFADFGLAPGSNAWFIDSGRTLLLLTQTGDVAAKGGRKTKTKPPPGFTKSSYFLFKINMKTLKSERLAAFEHLTGAALVTLGSPLQMATAIAFSGNRAACFSGPASLLDINLKEGEGKAMHSTGQYELVETPLGRMLVDLKKHNILSFDINTFQQKVLRHVPDDDRALFFDPAKKVLITWNGDSASRGLSSYDAASEDPVKTLPLKHGERVLQRAGLFATARLNTKENTIEINHLAGWTGERKGNHYSIAIPPAYPVDLAAIEVDFNHHLALISGSTFAVKQSWQRVFIFDYAKGQMLVGMPVTGNQYINYAAIDPSGSNVFFEVRDSLTRRTIGAKVYDLGKKSFEEVDLELGLSDK